MLKEGSGQQRAPLTGEPCVWWYFAIDEQIRNGKNNQRWRSRWKKPVAPALLCLNDGTGDCLIDPQGAQVFPTDQHGWYGSTRHAAAALPRQNILQSMLSGVKRYRYTEQRLHVE